MEIDGYLSWYFSNVKMHSRRACNAKTDYPDVAYPSAWLFAPFWIVLYGYGIAINGVSSDRAMVSLLIILGYALTISEHHCTLVDN